ncbi:hypothetical protein MVI01_08530 [Myxococcus virescens]|uniref:Uncharacterized protein n=1 Tax=Myxococcus virescens TaxID=83456 RepID=A0A511H8K3_9BACT|nr:hypothetical protein MVI01_08530 [Myxococcus virescens]
MRWVMPSRPADEKTAMVSSMAPTSTAEARMTPTNGHRLEGGRWKNKVLGIRARRANDKCLQEPTREREGAETT